MLLLFSCLLLFCAQSQWVLPETLHSQTNVFEPASRDQLWPGLYELPSEPLQVTEAVCCNSLDEQIESIIIKYLVKIIFYWKV